MACGWQRMRCANGAVARVLGEPATITEQGWALSTQRPRHPAALMFPCSGEHIMRFGRALQYVVEEKK